MATPVIDPASRRAVFRRATAALVLACAACGGSSATAPARPLVPPPPPTEDLSIELPAVTLEGTLFVPEGLPPPPVPVVRPARRTTLDKQRTAWRKLAADAKAPLARKATEAQVLATLLLDRVRTLAPEAPSRAELLAEARAALAAVHDAARGAADRVTLEMAAALALGAGDQAAAGPYLEELIARFPDEPAARMARTQLAFVKLVAGSDASALVAGDEPGGDRPDLAYVIAWVRFRAGDGPGAAKAIATAAAAWKDDDTRPAIVRDYLVLSTRGGVAPAAAADGLAALVPAPPSRAAVLLDLARAYELAGLAADADDAIDVALARAGSALGPADVVAARRAQAEYARQAGRVDALADRWSRVATALERCPDCSADMRGAIATELAHRAYELHTIYVTAGDPRAKAAALGLYRVHATLAGAPDAAAVAAHARELERARVPEAGGQYDEAVRAPLSARLQEVLACFEARLQGDRKLGGPLTVRLEVDQRGAVTGVATEPAGGLDGMAAVASCVDERARRWWLPSRPRPGVARITLPFTLGAIVAP